MCTMQYAILRKLIQMSINRIHREIPENEHAHNQLLIDLLSQTDQLTLPEGFEDTSSWRRAQRYTSIIGSVNPGQWQISLPRANGSIGGDYRVTFCVETQEHESQILSDCQCKGYEFDDICCHVLYFW
jgi:hypothetical protein